MVGKIMGSPCADIFFLPVVTDKIAVFPDIYKLNDRLEHAAVLELELHRVGLDEIVLILEVLSLFLMAARPARHGAGAVDAFLLRVPDAVAGLVH